MSTVGPPISRKEDNTIDIEAKLADLDARERTSEHRLKDLEADMRDLRELTQAVAVTSANVRDLTRRVDEMHGDIKTLGGTAGSRWNAAVEWLIKGAVGALVGAFMALVLR